MEKTIAELGLTELETKILNALISELYAEEGFTDVTVKKLSTKSNISTKQVRGVITSLTEKNIVNMFLGDDRKTKFFILDTAYWYLHPRWKDYYYVLKNNGVI